MHALLPAQQVLERGGSGTSSVWRPADVLLRPAHFDKAALASIRRAAAEIVSLCAEAGAAVDQPSLNIAAQGVAFHADDINILARELGGRP